MYTLRMVFEVLTSRCGNLLRPKFPQNTGIIDSYFVLVVVYLIYGDICRGSQCLFPDDLKRVYIGHLEFRIRSRMV